MEEKKRKDIRNTSLIIESVFSASSHGTNILIFEPLGIANLKFPPCQLSRYTFDKLFKTSFNNSAIIIMALPLPL